MEHIVNWLIEQEPWVRYRTKIDLMGMSIDHPEVMKDYEEMINHPLVSALLEELKEWPGPLMKRHNDSNLLYHKLVFLADLGIAADHPIIEKVITKMLDSQSVDGPFQIMGNIPTVFGGSGKDELMWMLCDAPLLVYAMVKLGQYHHPKVIKAIDYLLSLIQDFGWPCAATGTLGKKFKGPGKRTDPCPYANLIMLRLITLLPDLHNSKEAKTGAAMLLGHWDKRKEKKYFLFGMGTDFCKLKAPFIWYDILHTTNILTQFKFLKSDKRLKEMLLIIQAKADENDLYKAESVYMSWKKWDFGQKKTNSGWITFLVYQIINRVSNL